MPYIDPKTIEEVKRIDLLTYLQENEPDELVKLGQATYCTRTHDSLKISNGKWYWWSRGFGGKSALDYLIKVREMTFMDAASHLIERNRTSLPSTPDARPKPQKRKPFWQPPRSLHSERAVSYLRIRGVDPLVIRHCQNLGLIYESNKDGRINVVFLGLDSHGTPRYAAIRGCTGDFKGEATGSDKRHAFRLMSQTKNPEVHIFESAIDALSFATLLVDDDIDFREHNLLSLGGIPPLSAGEDKRNIPQAIVQYLADNPHTRTIHLHLDRDEPGLHASDAIATALYKRCEVFITPPEFGKDMNDHLLAVKKRYSLEDAELDDKRIARQAGIYIPKRERDSREY